MTAYSKAWRIETCLQLSVRMKAIQKAWIIDREALLLPVTPT
ncbi:hypothetical protein [Panacagrimonas sp.]